MLFAVLLGGCTPVEKVGSKRSDASRASVDFDDLWVAAGYPCAGRAMPMLFRIEQTDKTLTALSLIRSECNELGDRLWRGTLPHAPILRSELPITFEVELAARAGNASARGTGTVVSIDRMLLDVGSAPLIVTRAETAAEEAELPLDPAADSSQPTDAGTTPRVREGVTRVQAGGGGSAGSNADDQRAGSGSPATTVRDWYCLSYQSSCTCVGGLGMSADMCNTPKPSCCFVLTAIGQPSCQCWPLTVSLA